MRSKKKTKKRRDYWRLYYKAVDAAHEVDSIVADAEIRTLIDYGLRYGRLPDDWREQVAKHEEDKAEEEKQPPVENEIDDDDIPPRQLGLWNNEEE